MLNVQQVTYNLHPAGATIERKALCLHGSRDRELTIGRLVTGPLLRGLYAATAGYECVSRFRFRRWQQGTQVVAAELLLLVAARDSHSGNGWLNAVAIRWND